MSIYIAHRRKKSASNHGQNHKSKASTIKAKALSIPPEHKLRYALSPTA